MEFRTKIHPSVLKCRILESAIDKKELNITLISQLRSITGDIKEIILLALVLVKFEIFCTCITCELQTVVQDFVYLW